MERRPCCPRTVTATCRICSVSFDAKAPRLPPFFLCVCVCVPPWNAVVAHGESSPFILDHPFGVDWSPSPPLTSLPMVTTGLVCTKNGLRMTLPRRLSAFKLQSPHIPQIAPRASAPHDQHDEFLAQRLPFSHVNWTKSTFLFCSWRCAKKKKKGRVGAHLKDEPRVKL